MSSNKKDLKAYVRFDGSGRIVAGSLVLRRQKPKVGNWQQIQAYECCDPDFPTTTTTSTSTTTVAPVSDFRLKENIVPTGNFVGGLTEYNWDWNSTAKALGVDKYPTVGVLAQDALEKYPQHVVLDTELGYYRVNLEAIKASGKN